MIRKMKETDIDKVTNIWLETNLKAHNFISPQYWNDNFQSVKEALLQAEVYVYEDESQNRIEGFIGLNNTYIEGIFVRSESQSHGIGKKLLDFVKQKKQQLNLHVYEKNTRALKFYQRENFHIHTETTDEPTREKEYHMHWNRKTSQ